MGREALACPQVFGFLPQVWPFCRKFVLKTCGTRAREGATAQEEVASQSMKPEAQPLLPVGGQPGSPSHQARADLAPMPTGQPKPAAEAESKGASDAAPVTQMVGWKEVPPPLQGEPGTPGAPEVQEVLEGSGVPEGAAASARSTPGLKAKLIVGGDGSVALELTFAMGPLPEGDAAAGGISSPSTDTTGSAQGSASSRLFDMSKELLGRRQWIPHGVQVRQVHRLPILTHP